MTSAQHSRGPCYSSPGVDPRVVGRAAAAGRCRVRLQGGADVDASKGLPAVLDRTAATALAAFPDGSLPTRGRTHGDGSSRVRTGTATIPSRARPQSRQALGHLGHQVIKPDSPREQRIPPPVGPRIHFRPTTLMPKISFGTTLRRGMGRVLLRRRGAAGISAVPPPFLLPGPSAEAGALRGRRVLRASRPQITYPPTLLLKSAQ